MIQHVEGLLQRLHQQRVDFVIVGGVCNVLHGATLVTQDVEFCCDFSVENLRRLQAAVEDLHPVHRLTPKRLPFELTEELIPRLKNLYLRTDLGVIDCLSEIAGIGPFDAVSDVSVPVGLPFGNCQMLSLEALIQSKEALGREHDLAALRQLRAIQERNSKPDL